MTSTKKHRPRPAILEAGPIMPHGAAILGLRGVYLEAFAAARPRRSSRTVAELLDADGRRHWRAIHAALDVGPTPSNPLTLLAWPYAAFKTASVQRRITQPWGELERMLAMIGAAPAKCAWLWTSIVWWLEEMHHLDTAPDQDPYTSPLRAYFEAAAPEHTEQWRAMRLPFSVAVSATGARDPREIEEQWTLGGLPRFNLDADHEAWRARCHLLLDRQLDYRIATTRRIASRCDGLLEVPTKREAERHAQWLAASQVAKQTHTQIAKAAGVDRSMVTKAIGNLARLIGLPLHAPNRPGPARSVSWSSIDDAAKRAKALRLATTGEATERPTPRPRKRTRKM